ncbi:MAG: AMP-binding protein, partial [Promethearchaeota archaeon]
YVIAVLGTLRAGCIVSGVSPLLSPVQIVYQLNDLGSTGKKVGLVTLDTRFSKDIIRITDKIDPLKIIIVTKVDSFAPNSEDLVKSIGKISEVVVPSLESKTVLDFTDDIIKKSSKEDLNMELSPEDVGWIQYTGGTTGPPKGAMLTHKNRVSNFKSLGEWLKWENGKEIMLSGFPFFHIGGINVCEICLYHATTQLMVLNPRDTDYMIKLIDQYHPTMMANVPSLYQLLMNKQTFKELDHSKLRSCISAAAPFPKESQIELEKIIGKNKLLEVFGMTELSPIATMNPYLGKKKLGTIGMPIQNINLKIVDPITGAVVPLGENGEILVHGPLVMKGYHNNPEETKNAVDEDMYMHTGDIGIMDEDGYISIVDRKKDMIIVGGFKVFSTKVEDVLSKHPAVGMVALIGIPNPDRPGSEIVKAYIQLHADYEFEGGEEVVREDLTKFAKENCAPYEVPKIFEIVDVLPLTAVGKIDKKLLRK